MFDQLRRSTTVQIALWINPEYIHFNGLYQHIAYRRNCTRLRTIYSKYRKRMGVRNCHECVWNVRIFLSHDKYRITNTRCNPVWHVLGTREVSNKQLTRHRHTGRMLSTEWLVHGEGTHSRTQGILRTRDHNFDGSEIWGIVTYGGENVMRASRDTQISGWMDRTVRYEESTNSDCTDCNRIALSRLV